MSLNNAIVNITTKKYKWDENSDNIVFLQNEIDGLANAIQNRFYKENFNDNQVLTSNGEAPNNNNQINLYGYDFGMVSLNLSVRSTDGGNTIKNLYLIDVGFEDDGGLTILQQNTNEFYKSGTNMNDVLITIDIVGGFLQISINPQGTEVNASISIKVSSA